MPPLGEFPGRHHHAAVAAAFAHLLEDASQLQARHHPHRGDEEIIFCPLLRIFPSPKSSCLPARGGKSNFNVRGKGEKRHVDPQPVSAMQTFSSCCADKTSYSL